MTAPRLSSHSAVSSGPTSGSWLGRRSVMTLKRCSWLVVTPPSLPLLPRNPQPLQMITADSPAREGPDPGSDRLGTGGWGYGGGMETLELSVETGRREVVHDLTSDCAA